MDLCIHSPINLHGVVLKWLSTRTILPYILREEHRVRVFENRVLRKIFAPKRNDVTGEWRKLHNEELRDL
jgi:hypothetical protein